MSTEPIELSAEMEALLGSAVKPGRRGQTPLFAIERNLQPEDLLEAREATAIQPIPIQDLKYSHHQLARLVAQGEKNAVISEITGYTPSRISILKDDPQFKELVEHYAEMEGEAHTRSRADFHERLATLGFDSIQILHQRLIDEPESISTAELTKITEAVADRTGHGKTSTVNSTHAHYVLSPQDLRAIREGAAPRETDPAAEASRESLLRLAVRATDPHSPGETLEGSEGEGSELREESGEVIEGDFTEAPPG